MRCIGHYKCNYPLQPFLLAFGSVIILQAVLVLCQTALPYSEKRLTCINICSYIPAFAEVVLLILGTYWTTSTTSSSCNKPMVQDIKMMLIVMWMLMVLGVLASVWRTCCKHKDRTHLWLRFDIEVAVWWSGWGIGVVELKNIEKFVRLFWIFEVVCLIWYDVMWEMMIRSHSTQLNSLTQSKPSFCFCLVFHGNEMRYNQMHVQWGNTNTSHIYKHGIEDDQWLARGAKTGWTKPESHTEAFVFVDQQMKRERERERINANANANLHVYKQHNNSMKG